MKRLYVAGHTGLVGSALIRHFSKQRGLELITATREQLNLLEGTQVEQFLLKQKPDAVIIAAGRVGGISANSAQGGQFFYENMMIQTHLIQGALKAGVTRLLNFGSSCMYPKLTQQPMRIEQLMTGPLEATSAPYAVAKWAGLTLVQAYRRQYGVHFITVIPATVFGPGDNFNPEEAHVLSALMTRLQAAQESGATEITLWGSGAPKREFLYSSDLAQACELLLTRYDEAKPINVGSGQVVSIEQLAQQISQVVGFKGQIFWDRSRPDGAPEKTLESSAVEALGWSAQTPLQLGIEQTYAWFLEHSRQAQPELEVGS